MTTTASEQHKKHANLSRPAYGNFGRNELAILGAPCGLIQEKARLWSSLLKAYNIGYADADHNTTDATESPFAIAYSDKITHGDINFKNRPDAFQNRVLFNSADLIFINGNHFTGLKQLVIVHPDKSLENKLDKLTDVALVLLAEGMQLPHQISACVNCDVPVLALNDDEAITAFLPTFIKKQVPPVNGLVLAGGESKRMHTDKGSIVYHGKNQRAHSFELLSGYCQNVFISGNDADGYPNIPDTFTGLGPFGGILSAMQNNPDSAWLTIACDLPFLTEKTLKFLTDNRNPSKLATAFKDSDGKFPEPLITIWEPRAYPIMLQFLSQGYSCPRKVLINTDIQLLDAPDVSEFRNINLPHERDEVLRFFGG